MSVLTEMGADLPAQFTDRRTEARAVRHGLACVPRRRRKLVRRSHFLTIIAAWVVTVPAAAALSGAIFLGIMAITG